MHKKTGGLTTEGGCVVNGCKGDNVFGKITFLGNQGVVDSGEGCPHQGKRGQELYLDAKTGCGRRRVRVDTFMFGGCLAVNNCALVFNDLHEHIVYNYIPAGNSYYESIHIEEFIPEFPIIEDGEMALLQAIYPLVDFGLLVDVSYTEMKYRKGVHR